MARGGRRGLIVEVERWASVVDEWTAKKARAAVELEQRRAESGELVIDSPDLAPSIAKEIQVLRDAIDMAEQAALAAAPRLENARVAVLEFDATQHDAAAKKLRAAYDAHCRRTDELLAQLEQHECRFVPEREWASAARANGDPRAPESWSTPKSGRMFLQVECELTRAGVLRDVAAGVDPAVRLRELSDFVDGKIHGVEPIQLYPPAVWGPEAVVPAPAFLDRVAAVRRRLVDHDAEVDRDDTAEIEKRQAVIDDLNEVKSQRNGVLTGSQVQQLEVREAWIAERETWRREAPKRRQEIVAELESLIGPAALAEV